MILFTQEGRSYGAHLRHRWKCLLQGFSEGHSWAPGKSQFYNSSVNPFNLALTSGFFGVTRRGRFFGGEGT